MEIIKKVNPIILFLLTILSFVILFVTIIVWKTYKSIVYIIVKIQYRDNFGGFVTSCDRLWTIENQCRCIINAFAILESDQDVIYFNEKMKNVINDKFFKQRVEPKVTSVKAKSLGYSFLIKNQITFEELSKTINVEGNFDKNYLHTFISSCSNKPLPKNDRALWEVVFFDQPIKWSKNSKKNQYLLVLRFHHSLGDGYAVTKQVLEHLCKGGTEKNKFVVLPKLQKASWWSDLYCALLGPSVVLNQTIFRSVDNNILHNKKLSSEKITVCACEEEERLVPLVKAVKNKIPDTAFSDVVLTAISASFRDYFRKKLASVPKDVTAVVPIMFNYGQEITLTNHISLVLFDLPVSSNDLVTMLKKVSECSKRLKNSPDFLVNYWTILLLSSLLPDVFLQFVTSDHGTALVSLLPGAKKISIQDFQVRDIGSFVPNRDSTGVSMVVLSYDNRFQVTLNVDKNIISNCKDALEITDGIFKYIEELYTVVVENSNL